MKNLRNNGYVYYFRVDIFTVINNKIYQILHFQYTVYCELYFSKAVFNVEIKTTQMRMGKGHLFRAYGRHSKADRPVGSFVIEKGRYVLVQDNWQREAIDSLTESGGILCAWLGVYIWLSTVGHKLEAGAKIRAAVSY